MDTKELFNKIKSENGIKLEETYSEVLKWGSQNLKEMNLDTEEQPYLYDELVTYMLKDKILNISEANILIQYLAKSYLHQQGIQEAVKEIKTISNPAEFVEERRKDNGGLGKTLAYYLNKSKKIVYGPEIINRITSDSLAEKIDAIHCVIHEAVHAKQWCCIENTQINGKPTNYTSDMYLLMLENLARGNDPNFYKQNYNKLILENMAEKEGYIATNELMKKYTQAGFDYEWFIKKVGFDDKTAENLEIFGKNRERIQGLESVCSKICSKYPQLLKKYPILGLKYNENGIRKDIKTLLQEREEKLRAGQDTKEVDKLYKTLTSFGIRDLSIRSTRIPVIRMYARSIDRIIYSTPRRIKQDRRSVRRAVYKNKRGSIRDLAIRVNPEIRGIKRYIAETGTDDKFVYELLEERLKTKRVKPEKIEEIINEQKTLATQKREQMHSKQVYEQGNDEIAEANKWLARGKKWNSATDKDMRFAKMKFDIVRAIKEKVINRNKRAENNVKREEK